MGVKHSLLMDERIIDEGRFFVNQKCTIRQAAKVYLVSKTKFHLDITKRLESLDPSLAKEVRKILDLNKSERHIRGGLAIKKKYLQKG